MESQCITYLSVKLLSIYLEKTMSGFSDTVVYQHASLLLHFILLCVRDLKILISAFQGNHKFLACMRTLKHLLVKQRGPSGHNSMVWYFCLLLTCDSYICPKIMYKYGLEVFLMIIMMPLLALLILNLVPWPPPPRTPLPPSSLLVSLTFNLETNVSKKSICTSDSSRHIPLNLFSGFNGMK